MFSGPGYNVTRLSYNKAFTYMYNMPGSNVTRSLATHRAQQQLQYYSHLLGGDVTACQPCKNVRRWLGATNKLCSQTTGDTYLCLATI